MSRLLAVLLAAATLGPGAPAAAAATRVIVKQRQTNQGVTYLGETRARPEAGIFKSNLAKARDRADQAARMR